MRYHRLTGFFLLWLPALLLPLRGQDYAAFFDEAYESYPSIPRGLLESIAWNNTRIKHLVPDTAQHADCLSMPAYYGVMGLVEDGKGYFENTLQRVAALSGYSIAEIKNDPRINIFAYAKAYANTVQGQRSLRGGYEPHRMALMQLSEIPNDGSPASAYALDQQVYGVMHAMEGDHPGATYRISAPPVDMQGLFGENLRVLEAPRVNVADSSVRSLSGQVYSADRSVNNIRACAQGAYRQAIWNVAHANNYGSRGNADIRYITIHTVQGSYASAIAWFRNPNARVSAHYIIRAFDGQLTQMVCDFDKAYHVRDDNDAAIGIEHEGFVADGATWYTTAMYEASAELVKDLCKRHTINPLQCYSGPPSANVRVLGSTCTRIKGHQHFPNNTHTDPGLYWDWQRYYLLINGEINPKTLSARKGTLTDPGGSSGNYPDQARMTWLIAPDNTRSLSLRFSAFNMEADRTNQYDFLDIYDGRDRNGKYLGRFSGTERPPDLTARSGAFFIEFRSDCRVNRAGWVAEWEADRGTVACPLPAALKSDKIYPFGALLSWQGAGATQWVVQLRRSGIAGAEWQRFPVSGSPLLQPGGLAADAEYQWQVAAICGADTTSPVGGRFLTPPVSKAGAAGSYAVKMNEGLLYDSGGPEAVYGHRENWTYTLRSEDGGKIRISFLKFDTESGHDILSLYDGADTTAPRLVQLSGGVQPISFTAGGDALTLHFRSDGALNTAGWEAVWRSIDPPRIGAPIGPFMADIGYSATAPESNPRMEPSYNRPGFSPLIEDKDRSGKGISARFYLLEEASAGGWSARNEKGFLRDDFERSAEGWQIQTGNWQLREGRWVQIDPQPGNTNAWKAVEQDAAGSYLYAWTVRSSGAAENRRAGMHFFCSEPQRENRGSGYFVYARDDGNNDLVEIYRVSGDRFSRKAMKAINWQTGRTYEFKVSYTPATGEIVVYLNNQRVLNWKDPSPIRKGSAISLRSGGCVAEFDEVQVWRSRGERLQLKAGTAAGDDLRSLSNPAGTPAFQLRTMALDGAGQWSRPMAATAAIGPAQAATPPVPATPPVSPPPTAPAALSAKPWVRAEYSSDFFIDVPPRQGTARQFILVSDYDGRRWTANPAAGHLYEDFDPGSRWLHVAGDWQVTAAGELQQNDLGLANSNTFFPVEQDAKGAVLYQWKGKLLSSGQNARFGMHFYCSDPRAANRGDSYMVWFRYRQGAEGQVEIYRAANDELQLKTQALMVMSPEKWMQIQLLYDPATGDIQVWSEGQRVLSWTDPAPLRGGSAVSFRTGNARVAFDELRIFREHRERTYVRLGASPLALLRYPGKQLTPAGRIWFTELETGLRWRRASVAEIRVRF